MPREALNTDTDPKPSPQAPRKLHTLPVMEYTSDGPIADAGMTTRVEDMFLALSSALLNKALRVSLVSDEYISINEAVHGRPPLP